MIYVNVQGVEVPALGFGTWQLSGEECRAAVADALAIGYRHIDTAQMYENEAEVGQGLRQGGVPREEVFLTTKVWYTALAPKAVRRTTEESLRRLQTDYVDLLLIHWPNEAIPLEDTLDAMLALESEGKTRHIGVSNFTPALIERATAHAPIFCNQVEYHPFLSQAALLEQAEAHDYMLTAYCPIAKNQVSDDPVLRRLASEYGKSPVQVTLRWLVQQPHVAAIPKAARPEHRRSNFEIFDFSLEDEDMKAISTLARGKRLVHPAWAVF